MKKFIALVVMLCAVLISLSASAADYMPKWEFVIDEIAVIPPDPKYSRTPDQYYHDSYYDSIALGFSPRQARKFAENRAQEYQYEYLRNMNPQPQKKGSFYIDVNSIGVDQTEEGGVAFHVLVRYDYTPFGRESFIEDFKKAGKIVPYDMDKLSFLVALVHFKSPNGITKYSAIPAMMAFTTEGNPIKALTISDEQLDWKFINHNEYFDYVFDAAYRHL